MYDRYILVTNSQFNKDATCLIFLHPPSSLQWRVGITRKNIALMQFIYNGNYDVHHSNRLETILLRRGLKSSAFLLKVFQG
jgi:hypothetical protein